MNEARIVPTRGFASPVWWLVLKRELSDLWIGGKALILVFLYSIYLGVVAYVIASSSELSLIPPKEMVYELILNVMAVSLFMGLIISADSLSGERERNTFESLLLTPASRRQIIVGKFLAAVTFWPVAFIIAIPIFKLLSQGDEVFRLGLIWGGMIGTVMVLGYVALGMLVSFLANSNRTSYFVSLAIYALFLVPAQLPSGAQSGAMGQFLQWANPIAATNHFLSKILVSSSIVSRYRTWLEAPIIFCVLLLIVLFLFAAPGLRLENGAKSKLWGRIGRTFGMGMLVMLVVGATPVRALQNGSDSGQSLQISIDMNTKTVKTSESIFFNTEVKNTGTMTSSKVFAAMNIVNLREGGEPIDPEDWSPQRTQSIEPLKPGEATTLKWRVNAILEGNLMIYVVAIPQPEGSDVTSQPVASSGIHVTVMPYTKLNPMSVLPIAIGNPILILIAIYLVNRRRRRQIDAGVV